MTENEGKRVSARQLATRTIKELEEEVAYFKENVPLILKENEKLKCQVQQFEAIGTIEDFKALKEFKKTITEIVNSQLIAGKNNYKEIYDCFQKIAKSVQDNY